MLLVRSLAKNFGHFYWKLHSHCVVGQDGLKGEKLVFAEGAFEANSVLYLRNCVDCDFVVNVHSAKVLVEGCTNCRCV